MTSSNECRVSGRDFTEYVEVYSFGLRLRKAKGDGIPESRLYQAPKREGL